MSGPTNNSVLSYSAFIQVTPGPSIDSKETAEVIVSLKDELIESAANGDTSMAANIAINIVDVLNTKSGQNYLFHFFE